MAMRLVKKANMGQRREELRPGCIVTVRDEDVRFRVVDSPNEGDFCIAVLCIAAELAPQVRRLVVASDVRVVERAA